MGIDLALIMGLMLFQSHPARCHRRMSARSITAPETGGSKQNDGKYCKRTFGNTVGLIFEHYLTNRLVNCIFCLYQRISVVYFRVLVPWQQPM